MTDKPDFEQMALDLKRVDKEKCPSQRPKNPTLEEIEEALDEAYEAGADDLEEVEVDRDQLHDALEKRFMAAQTEDESADDYERGYRQGQQDLMNGVNELLYEVERGDTVDRIERRARRETFKEAAGAVCDMCRVGMPRRGSRHYHEDAPGTTWPCVAAPIHALAEDDDERTSSGPRDGQGEKL